MARHVISLFDLEESDILHLVDRSLRFSAQQGLTDKPLKDRVVAIYFRKTSTRTRTSFSVGALKLGASIVTFGPHDLQTNTGETIEDTARVLSGYLDGIVMRTSAEMAELHSFAAQGTMSVINAMTENEHPTQAIADLATLKAHFGRLDGLHIAYLGEGNNSATALAAAVGKVGGMTLTLLTPEGYGVPVEFLGRVQAVAKDSGSRIEQYHSCDALPRGVDAVYTTRWQTTGTSKPDPNWRASFAPFTVTRAVMERASKPAGTIFLHDLPAVRGEDVEASVIDGEQSQAFRQAQFKLYSAMAILEWCIA